MNHRTRYARIVLLLAGIALAGVVGQAQASAQDPAEPQLKANPLETLRNFEPPANEEYRIGKGDEITVDFAGRPDLSAKLVVGPDGRITLPLAGDVMLSGQTRVEAASAIDQLPAWCNRVVGIAALCTVAGYIA